MAPKRRTVLGAAVAVGFAGCLGDDEGDGNGGMDDETESPTATETPSDDETTTETSTDDGTATVQVRSHDELGDVLVGPEEMTLYMFDQDTKGEGASACYDDCADAWPPLTVDDSPTAGDGVTAGLTTFEREDGSTQVSVDGWPLYYFVNDEESGDANGQGVNDVWWVLDSDGSPMREADSDTPQYFMAR
jgi:predicted lipoprotein with Yx(FWY)xxD motif